MNNAAKLGVGVGGGYLLGRTKKLKLAIGLGAWLMGRRLQLSPSQLLMQGLTQLRETEEFGELSDRLRTEVGGAGKRALAAAATSRMDSLTDRLHERNQGSAGEDEDDYDEDEDAPQARDEDEDEDEDLEEEDDIEDEYEDEDEDEQDEDDGEIEDEDEDDGEIEDEDEDEDDIEDEYDEDEDEDEDEDDEGRGGSERDDMSEDEAYPDEAPRSRRASGSRRTTSASPR